MENGNIGASSMNDKSFEAFMGAGNPATLPQSTSPQATYAPAQQQDQPGKFVPKPNTGTIWLEVQKKEGTQGPYEVRTGSLNVSEPGDYYVNAYYKQLAGGKEILSLTLKKKEQPPQQQ